MSTTPATQTASGYAVHHRRLWPVRCEDTGEVITSYARYMQSNHWKRVKTLFKHSQYHTGRCYVCGSTDRLEIHHKTYVRIGHEDLTNLQELCELCHSLAHNLAMTGAQMGVTIGNAADAMLGDCAPGSHSFTKEGREWFHQTSRRQQKRCGQKRQKFSGDGVIRYAEKPQKQPGVRIVRRRNFNINGSTSEMECPKHGLVNTVGDNKGRRCCPECGNVLRK